MVAFSSPVLADHFSVSATDLSKDINTGSSSFFDPITLSVSGNESVDLDLIVEGEPQLVFVPGSLTIPANSSVLVSISVVVPTDISPDGYVHKINFTSVNETKQLRVVIEVSDSISPTITGCTLSTINTNRTRQIDVNCQDVRDNVEVQDVFIEVDNQNIFLNQNGNAYSGSFVIKSVGNYNSTLFATDESNNIANLTFPIIEITEFNPVQVSSLDLQNLKFNVEHKRVFARILETANLSIRIDRLGYTENQTTDLDYLILTPNGEGRSIPIGEVIDLNSVEAGDMIIRLKGDEIGEFSGSISMFFDGTEYAMNIKGIMSQYTILPNTTFNWFNVPVWCAGNDAGSIQNSSTTCVLTYPALETLNETAFPVNFQLYNDLNLGGFGDTLMDLERKTNESLIYMIISIVLGIVLVGIFAYRYYEEMED